jgi:hypothetical protein
VTVKENWQTRLHSTHLSQNAYKNSGCDHTNVRKPQMYHFGMAYVFNWKTIKSYYSNSIVLCMPLKRGRELLLELLPGQRWLAGNSPPLPSYSPPSFPLRVSALPGPYLSLPAFFLHFWISVAQYPTSALSYSTSTLHPPLAATPYSLLHSGSTHLFCFP